MDLLAVGLLAAVDVDPSTLGQYGALGVLNAALLAFARIAYNRERDRADAERAKVDEMQELYRKDSEQMRDALKESLRTMSDLAARLRP